MKNALRNCDPFHLLSPGLLERVTTTANIGCHDETDQSFNFPKSLMVILDEERCVCVSDHRRSSLPVWSVCILLAITLLWVTHSVPAEDVTDHFIEDLAKLEGGLGPGTVEGPFTIRYDPFGDRFLVWEMGDPDVLRLFESNFVNMTVLDLPIPAYDVKGVEFGNQGQRIIAWGRGSGSANDTLAVYWTSNHTLDTGFAPDGSLPLQTLDAVRGFANDFLLAIGGRDGSGTSRLMVIEVASGWVLADDLVADNRTVEHIGSDGKSMVVLDDMSGLYV